MHFCHTLPLATVCVWLALLGDAGCFPTHTNTAKRHNPLITRLAKLQAQIHHLQEKIGDTTEYSDDPVQVAFSVSMEKSHIVSTGSHLPFDRVLTNIGGHYNANNNEFVAPVTGTYVFTVNAVCGTYSYMHIALYQNETPAFRTLCDNRTGSSQQQSGGITPLRLTKGDKISVRMVYPLATSSEAYGSGMTSFSGFLL
ncbi:complement C1q tumor necrosis factor-related protein 2-like [Dreissena polymorpha]|uniref:C1q domain-containing protein n=1 Tax=Dreissena polymorpha TaxID=45954 RepID=A0A9D4FG38_DREPO|nr:complement C1q tumor necrosis factor-related protein 2-like [Dreissena polymorpha]KAH3795945.1 hypothetical protein DPMN_149507 [Dreissena polymorpha]